MRKKVEQMLYESGLLFKEGSAELEEIIGAGAARGFTKWLIKRKVGNLI